MNQLLSTKAVDHYFDRKDDLREERYGNLPPIFVDRGDPAAVDFDTADFTKDLTFHTLDLSGIVPLGAAAVLLRVLFSHPSVNITASFRKKGNSNTINITDLRSQVASTPFGGDVIVPLSSDRGIEYRFSNVGIYDYIYVTVGGWWR